MTYPFSGIDPQGADASRLVGPQVVAGDVERAPVGVEPVAGDELPQGDHVAAGQVEGSWAGLPGETTPGRGDDPALVDPVAGQEALDRQDGQGVGLAVAGDDRVDELVAPPQQLLFLPLDQPGVLLPVQVGAGRSWPRSGGGAAA